MNRLLVGPFAIRWQPNSELNSRFSKRDIRLGLTSPRSLEELANDLLEFASAKSVYAN